MNLPDMPLLSLLREKMTWLNHRQDVLSQNVANANTPGYVAHDLKQPDFSDLLKGNLTAGSGMAVTDPRHIAARHASAGVLDDYSSPGEASPNGNAVSLEQEMIKVADTQAQFQAATNLYAKAMTMMKTAIGH